jgi:hypothetical protein
MHHAAIDLGGKESQICIRQPDGTIIEERKVPTRKLTELVATWAPSRVVMETSAEAFKASPEGASRGSPRHGWPMLTVVIRQIGPVGIGCTRAALVPITDDLLAGAWLVASHVPALWEAARRLRRRGDRRRGSAAGGAREVRQLVLG